MHTQESRKGMKKLRKDKFRKILAFMVALALMVSCVPSAYTISASETFGDGTEDFTDGESVSGSAAEEATPDVSSADQEKQATRLSLSPIMVWCSLSLRQTIALMPGEAVFPKSLISRCSMAWRLILWMT